METAKRVEILEGFARHAGDTGGTEVQVALLTQRVTEITDHLRIHRHDEHTRRGLFKLVGQRRRLLQYLKNEDVERYRSLIVRLGLRR